MSLHKENNVEYVESAEEILCYNLFAAVYSPLEFKYHMHTNFCGTLIFVGCIVCECQVSELYFRQMYFV